MIIIIEEIKIIHLSIIEIEAGIAIHLKKEFSKYAPRIISIIPKIDLKFIIQLKDLYI